MRRFVVLLHQIDAERAFKSGLESLAKRGTHFDLMLEEDDNLLTWALAGWPLLTGESTQAIELPPHRTAYLDYEGPISGGRGHVTRVASGTYCWDQESRQEARIAILQEQSRKYRLRITPESIALLHATR